MKKLEKWIFNKIIRNRYIDVDEVLQITPDGIFLKGEKLDEGQISELRQYAQQLKENPLFDLLTKQVKHLAQAQSVEASSWDRVLVLKGTHLATTVQEQTIERLLQTE